MKQNIGTVDRLIRVILGLVIITAGLYFESWWGLVGLLPIFTALIGWCGLYKVLGISTCKIKK